jgi:hypothetical protein
VQRGIETLKKMPEGFLFMSLKGFAQSIFDERYGRKQSRIRKAVKMRENILVFW